MIGHLYDMTDGGAREEAVRVIQVQIIVKLESAKYFIDLTSQFYFHIWISNVMQVSHSEQIPFRTNSPPECNPSSRQQHQQVHQSTQVVLLHPYRA